MPRYGGVLPSLRSTGGAAGSDSGRLRMKWSVTVTWAASDGRRLGMWQEMHSLRRGMGFGKRAGMTARGRPANIWAAASSAPGDVVRIVAGGAGELSGTGQEAGRFPQTVGRTGELEFVVEARARGVIEMQGVFSSGSPGR